MARIRTIKPEFFTSSDIVKLTPLARLFYVSLWCEADREGRLNWNTETLKIRYFPVDDCDIDELSDELVERELITIYEINGKQYAEIPSFKNHQVINNRESESVIPQRDFDACTRVTGEGRKEGRKGREVASKISLTDSGEWQNINGNIEIWKKAFPKIDIDAELLKMASWVIANPANKKSNYARFINNWLSKSKPSSSDDIFAGAL